MTGEQVIIIGGGPAGIAAAVQLHRQGLSPLLLEKDEIGGLLRNAHLVENYPGFPTGISGRELVSLFQQQLAVHKPKIVFEEVLSLDFDQGMFSATTIHNVYHSQTVLIASGTEPHHFTDIAIPEEAASHVYYDVFPLLGVTGKKIIIVGAGDAAFDYALNLGEQNEVIVLNRSERVKCLSLLRERVEESRNIEYHELSRLTAIAPDSSGGVLLECASPQRTLQWRADYLIFAIGRKPQLGFLTERLQQRRQELEERGLLYLAGDVKNRSFRQTAIAVGDGVMAAMKIARRLKETVL